MKVIRKIKSNINHSSDGVKGGRHRSAGATVTSAGVYAISRPNSIRGVINKCTPRTASLVLLPSLAVLAMFIGFSSIAPSVYADDDAGTIGVCTGSACPTTSTESTTFSIEDEKTIGITLSSEAIVLDISPTSSGAFKSKSFTVDVSTNNPTGYTLTMTADKTDLSRTSKINNETPTIPTIPTGKTFTEANFETGYWGYKLGTSTDYLPMTTSTIPVNTTESAANSSISTITFASKLNNSIPSGTYAGVTLSFVATTNVPPITYMQDMTTTSLASQCPAGVNTTVYDARDGKEYTVTQLDGVCIMTKNLQYIGGSDGTVSAGNGVNSAGNAFTMAANEGDSYDNAYYIVSTNTKHSDEYGVYYNYAAASGGTITGSSHNTTPATTSICPAGWALPASDTTGNTWGGISGSSIKNSGYFDVFAGEFDFTLRGTENVGYWWSSTSSGTIDIYGEVEDLRGRFINYKSGTFQIYDCEVCDGGRKSNKHNVRCILNK